MHGILTEHFLNQFYLKGNKGKAENYAVCLGMLRCLQSPYFEGQHDTWSLEHTSDDKTFLNYTQSGRQHRWEMVDLSDVDTHSLLDKEEAKKKAQSYIDLLDDQTKCLLFHPTTQDFHNKHDLTMEVIDGEHISKRLVALLGPYATSNLGQEGHTYHNLPHYSDQNDWQFVIAHNNREVGGILGFYDNEHDNSVVLSYVSVAEAFRNKGVSKRMLQHVVDYVKSHEKLLVRSTASDFSYEKGVSSSYNDFFTKQQVLHVATDTYAHQALYRALTNKIPYKDLLPYNHLFGYQKRDVGYDEKNISSQIDLALSSLTQNTPKFF